MSSNEIEALFAKVTVGTVLQLTSVFRGKKEVYEGRVRSKLKRPDEYEITFEDDSHIHKLPGFRYEGDPDFGDGPEVIAYRFRCGRIIDIQIR